MARSFWLLGLTILVGCGGPVCPAVRHPSTAGLVGSFEASRGRVVRLRGEARVERRDSGGRIAGTIMMLVERPFSVRIDALTQFGPAAILTSDEHRFVVTDLRENRVFLGEPCAANIERILSLPLAGPDVARLLFGEVPSFDGELENSSPAICSDGLYEVRRRGADGVVQTARFEVRPEDRDLPPNEQRLRLTEVAQRNSEDRVIFQVRLENYQVVVDPTDTESVRRGMAMPHRLIVSHPERGIQTTVRIGYIAINEINPPGAFEQPEHPELIHETLLCD